MIVTIDSHFFCCLVTYFILVSFYFRYKFTPRTVVTLLRNRKRGLCYRASSTLPGFTTLPASSSVSRFYTDILFSPTPPIRGSLEEINHGISLMNKS